MLTEIPRLLLGFFIVTQATLYVLRISLRTSGMSFVNGTYGTLKESWLWNQAQYEFERLWTKTCWTNIQILSRSPLFILFYFIVQISPMGHSLTHSAGAWASGSVTLTSPGACQRQKKGPFLMCAANTQDAVDILLYLLKSHIELWGCIGKGGEILVWMLFRTGHSQHPVPGVYQKPI